MNFFGHAAVAGWISAEPRWVLGAMLPDFVSMCRARVVAIEDPLVQAGVDMHHRTDDVFHGCPTFTALQRDGVDTLEARGVGRGTARAVAHVGTELLIDGLLLDDPAACEAYRAGVAVSGDLGIQFRRGGDRFAELRARAAGHGLPLGLRAPSDVAARLRRILASRPRLAFAEGDDDPVIEWLEATRGELEGRVDTLLTEVRDGLGAVDMDARRRAILRSREFPYSRGSESV
ncbi:MAG: hypothetical protein H6719_12220 [Sandaracinaceae bacterium]|nr:hypothetical protein [Sandaracinaceae bacterium]